MYTNLSTISTAYLVPEMCCMGMSQFWSRRKHRLLELGEINTQNKVSNAHVPLLESNLMVFEQSLYDQQRLSLDPVEIWLDESFGHGHGHKKQEGDKPKLTKWKSFLSPQSHNSTHSDTPREPQFRNWLWDIQSSFSGFSDFG